jgi:hypothetical protein
MGREFGFSLDELVESHIRINIPAMDYLSV